MGKGRGGEERKERKGKERKGKERKGKERKGKERNQGNRFLQPFNLLIFLLSSLLREPRGSFADRRKRKLPKDERDKPF